MEVPGIEPATSWLLVWNAEPYTKLAVQNELQEIKLKLVKFWFLLMTTNKESRLVGSVVIVLLSEQYSKLIP